MTLDYSMPGEVSIRMDDYVQEILEEVPADMSGTTATPAGEHLFVIAMIPPISTVSKSSEFFHHPLTAKLLFLCR
jgi:hypothetical protein